MTDEMNEAKAREVVSCCYRQGDVKAKELQDYSKGYLLGLEHERERTASDHEYCYSKDDIRKLDRELTEERARTEKLIEAADRMVDHIAAGHTTACTNVAFDCLKNYRALRAEYEKAVVKEKGK